MGELESSNRSWEREGGTQLGSGEMNTRSMVQLFEVETRVVAMGTRSCDEEDGHGWDELAAGFGKRIRGSTSARGRLVGCR